MKTLAEYHDIIIHLRADIQQHYHEFMRDPNDIETIHSLRVSIRQLRSLISFIRPLLNQKDYRIIQSKCRQLHQNSSDLRNLDVLMLDWKTFQEQYKTLIDYTNLSKVFQEQREYLKQEVMTYDFKTLFDETFSMINLTLAACHCNNFQKFVDNRLNKWARSIKKLSKSNEDIHALRIKYKKLRYVQTALELEVMDLKDLKKSQDILGDLNDTYTAIILLDDYSSRFKHLQLDDDIGLFKGYQLLKRENLLKNLNLLHSK